MYKYLSLILLLCLSACGTLRFPGVYKINIEQGNIVTQEMVDQLEPGMTRSQVEFIMGSPLIKDTFNADRWDYVYSIGRGDEPREQMTFSVFFADDQLSKFTGDVLPSSSTEEQQLNKKSEKDSKEEVKEAIKDVQEDE